MTLQIPLIQKCSLTYSILIKQVQQTSTSVKEILPKSNLSNTTASMENTARTQETYECSWTTIFVTISSDWESSTAMNMATSVQRIAESASSCYEFSCHNFRKADDGNKSHWEIYYTNCTQLTKLLTATSQVMSDSITHTNHIDTPLQSISNIAEQQIYSL